MIKSRILFFITYFIISIGLLSNSLYHLSGAQYYFMSNLHNKDKLNYSSNSSSWSLIWEVDSSTGYEIVTDWSNNVYILGRLYDPFIDTIFNTKFDKYGNEQWNSTWIFKNSSYISGFEVDTKQNIYNLLAIYSLEDYSVLMKIDSMGKSV